MTIPSNPKLYERVKAAAKRKFKVWPSAYASAWLVKEYKRRGGRYRGKKSKKSLGLQRWFDEKWINVCKLPKKVRCGRPKTTLSSWKKNYPYCRPSKRVTKSTPTTASQLSPAQIKRRCKQKRRSPLKKVSPKRKSKRRSPRRRSKRRSPRRRSKRRSPRRRSKRRSPRRRSPRRRSRRRSKRRSRRKSRRLQGGCWAGYERVPGTKKGEKGSCRKKSR